MARVHRCNKLHSLCCQFLQLFQISGSVFPATFPFALPSALCTVAVQTFMDRSYFGAVLEDASIWSSFVLLVVFLIVFRTHQAYSRFWDGITAIHQMRAEWFDAVSALIAFCKMSRGSEEDVLRFRHLVVRLFSLLHAAAFSEIEDFSTDDIEAYGYQLIGIEDIDDVSLQSIRKSSAKTELVYQWIQQLIVENIDKGVLTIPPPILSRVFQELANGMVQYHDAFKISVIPFPFPYTQTSDCLLFLHYIVSPFLIAQWVRSPVWAFIFSFIQVFVLLALRNIAAEIENPFGHDANDLNTAELQSDLNAQLLMIVSEEANRTPVLKGEVSELGGLNIRGTLAQMWSFGAQDIHDAQHQPHWIRYTTRSWFKQTSSSSSCNTERTTNSASNPERDLASARSTIVSSDPPPFSEDGAPVTRPRRFSQTRYIRTSSQSGRGSALARPTPLGRFSQDTLLGGIQDGGSERPPSGPSGGNGARLSVQSTGTEGPKDLRPGGGNGARLSVQSTEGEGPKDLRPSLASQGAPPSQHWPQFTV